jgi:ABC-type lipoprotein release transport system permease subunit
MAALVILALRQLSSARGLAAVLGLGIVVAATLLASAPIYARAMADLGLTFTIQQDLEGRSESRVEFPSIALQSPEGVALRETIERRIGERLGWFTDSVVRGVRLGRFTITTDGTPVGGNPPNAEPAAFQDYEDHVRVVEGRLPRRTGTGVLEVVLSAEAARAARVNVGDRVLLYQEFDNCEREIPGDGFPPPPPPCPITARVEFTFPVEIVGIVEPTDAADPFWPGTTSRYFRPYYLPLNGVGPISVMLADLDALTQDFGALFPSYRGYTIWSVNADTSILTRTNFLRARDDLVGLYAEFEPLGGFAISPLRDVLTSYGRTADYQQVPLLVLLLEITGIALFYIAIVAGVVVERQTPEIALLRGRGASIWQVLWMYLLQGLVIGIPTLLVAPFLAGALTALLGLTPLFDDISGGELLPVTIVPLAFGTAALGVVLSLFALLLPALFAARRGPAAIRRSISRPGVSFFQKYYLDLALAAVAGLLLFELNERGSVFTPSATGGVSSDPLLLASPALAIAAAGALILRFYPLFLRLVARASRPVAGAAVTLGLVQVVRNAGQYTRLALLLMMVVAVGTFAASYTRTADRSYLDRANHEAGVDIRASTLNPSLVLGTDPAQLEAAAAAIPGVTRASAVVRNSASIAVVGQQLAQYQLLAVDPDAAKTMLSFREDLAERSLADLMQSIEAPAALIGKQLPAGAETISLWARTDSGLSGQTLRLGLRDAAGQFAMLPITPTEEVMLQWQEFTASIADWRHTPVEPLSLVSIILTGASTRTGGPSLFLDDITVKTASGSTVVIEDFEDAVPWTRLPSVSPVPDTFEIVSEQPQSGSRAARFRIRSTLSEELRGIYIPAFLTPLPVVVSESFVASTGAGPGSEILLRIGSNLLVPAVVRGTFELFPTTASRDGPVIVFNRDRFLTWVTIANPGLGPVPEQNEVWISLAPDADTAAIEAALRAEPFKLERVTTRARQIERTTRNPLVAASGSGILTLAFIAVLGLAAAALLTSLLAAVRRRRVEFAVVQAIGLTRRQLLGMLALEYTIVFAMGVVAGCLLGLFVSDQMLSFLNVTENGERIEPGFILETRWGVVALGVGAVVAAFSVALWLASRSVGRGAEAQALRTE